jgi:hypothetical protein
MTIEAPSAIQYWQSELANKEEGTKQRYREYFSEFLSFVVKTPDELIVQRQQDLLNPDRKIQRRIESLLLAFLAKKKSEGYAVATRQIYFASIRSFFEIHYFPLIMRKGDYPPTKTYYLISNKKGFLICASAFSSHCLNHRYQPLHRLNPEEADLFAD